VIFEYRAEIDRKSEISLSIELRDGMIIDLREGYSFPDQHPIWEPSQLSPYLHIEALAFSFKVSTSENVQTRLAISKYILELRIIGDDEEKAFASIKFDVESSYLPYLKHRLGDQVWTAIVFPASETSGRGHFAILLEFSGDTAERVGYLWIKKPDTMKRVVASAKIGRFRIG
jgi:hypothetical protein